MAKWASGIAELSRDQRSGSAELEARAIELLEDLVGESSPGNAASEYRSWLLRVGRHLIGAQPGVSSLFRLVNDMLWACDGAGEAEQVRQKALDFLQHRRARQDVAQEAMAHVAAQHLAGYGSLMTYARSSSVLRALQLVPRQRLPRVYCGETRPTLEGQTLATELSWVGVEVTIGVDMALFDWLSEVQALVLGADTVSSAGVLNRVGARALVQAAAARELPRILLCTTYQYVPNAYHIVDPLPRREAEEIMPPAERIEIRNAYAGITPLDEFSLVITESGVHEVAQVRADLAALRIYPGLHGSMEAL